MNRKAKDTLKDIPNVSSTSSYDASQAVRAMDKKSPDFNPKKALEWAHKRHEARQRATSAA